MSKKARKNCNRCKCDQGRYDCELDYARKNKYYANPKIAQIMLGIEERIPTEPCPKPLTNNDWILARQQFKKQQTTNQNKLGK